MLFTLALSEHSGYPASAAARFVKITSASHRVLNREPGMSSIGTI